jgi:hypothetical protein
MAHTRSKIKHGVRGPSPDPLAAPGQPGSLGQQLDRAWEAARRHRLSTPQRQLEAQRDDLADMLDALVCLLGPIIDERARDVASQVLADELPGALRALRTARHKGDAA